MPGQWSRLGPMRRWSGWSRWQNSTRRGLDPSGQPAGGWYPELKVSLEEAVRAYTSGSAAAERATARRGSLAPGKDADLVVLSGGPFPLPAGAALGTGVGFS